MNIELISGKDAMTTARELETLRDLAWQTRIQDSALMQRFKFDDFDRIGWHVYIRNESGLLIAASRLNLIDSGEPIPDRFSFASVLDAMQFPCVYFNRSVVHPAFRKQYLWLIMIERRIEYVHTLDANEIWIELEHSMISHLYRFQFEIVSRSEDKEIPGNWFLLRRRLCT